MKSQKFPYITFIISILTIFYSLYINYVISGSFFGHVLITQLEPYGGITFRHLWNLELWRLFVAQIIHVKQFHMIYNVISFFLLGLILERYIGSFRFFILWFLPGIIGTLISTVTVQPPWNLGTGASQAILGIGALGFFIIWKKFNTTFFLKFIISFALIPALLLDLKEVHYPKLGHVIAFLVGLCISSYYYHKGKVTIN